MVVVRDAPASKLQQMSDRGAISFRDVYLSKLSAEWIKERFCNGISMDASTVQCSLANMRANYRDSSDIDLELKIGDIDRVRHYKNANWVRSEIELARCWVWPSMGGITWASGKLSEVAQRLSAPAHFPLVKEKRLKLDSIAGNMALIANALPIIVFVQESPNFMGLHPSYDGKRAENDFDIDDGCHRAIAAWQTSVMRLPAIVGRLPRAFR